MLKLLKILFFKRLYLKNIFWNICLMIFIFSTMEEIFLIFDVTYSYLKYKLYVKVSKKV